MSTHYYKQTEKGFELIGLDEYCELQTYRITLVKQREEDEKNQRVKEFNNDTI